MCVRRRTRNTKNLRRHGRAVNTRATPTLEPFLSRHSAALMWSSRGLVSAVNLCCACIDIQYTQGATASLKLLFIVYVVAAMWKKRHFLTVCYFTFNFQNSLPDSACPAVNDPLLPPRLKSLFPECLMPSFCLPFALAFTLLDPFTKPEVALET